MSQTLNSFKEYFTNMIIGRNGSLIGDIMTPTARPMTKRIAELPSLRYGSIGKHSMKSGPLRVSESLPKDVNKRKSHLPRFSEPKFGSLKATRRVRFALPPSDGDASATDADAVSVAEQTAGYDLHLPSRATVSQHSDILKQRYAGGQLYDSRRVPAGHLLDADNGVSITISPASRYRVHPTGRYIRGTLSPTANTAAPAAASPGGIAILRAARDGDDEVLKDILRRSVLVGISEQDLNGIDNSGRTTLSYIASNGSLDLLDLILQLPSLNVNRPDNEGNTPLHFAAQAGQVECLNVLLSRCKGLEIDAKNNLGFTPLMKAALQGRNKCAKVLLFAGANPTLRDSGRGLRADQWARFCGRYVCADVIEKHARQRLLERSTSYGNWGSDNDMGARVVRGKVVPVPHISQPENGIKSRLRKVFRTSSNPGSNIDHSSSARLITQLTTAALCASSPILPSAPSVPPVVKSLIRPLTVPRLQVTLANNNNDENHHSVHFTTNGIQKSDIIYENKEAIIKQSKIKKKK